MANRNSVIYPVFIKRLVDLIASIMIALFLLMPFAIISVLIKRNSKGPVFYRQKRFGKECIIFKILKFRTMVIDADKIGGFSTQVNDPRITSEGRFLRKWSLDELPQFLNVIVGDMSIIGPRPDVPAQAINYSAEELKARHCVRPGLTGLAQCRNRHDLSNRNRKRYDIFYNKNVSFLLDMKIAMWTVKIITKGSY